MTYKEVYVPPGNGDAGAVFRRLEGHSEGISSDLERAGGVEGRRLAQMAHVGGQFLFEADVFEVHRYSR